MDRTLTMDEMQRYLFRLVEELNFRISSVENNEIDVAEIAKEIPDVIKGKDGADGEDGVTYYTWIKYSPNADGSNMTNLPDANTKYIGIAYNNLSPTESTDPTDYTWSEIKGDQGAQGVGVSRIENEYYYSTSPSETIGSAWSNILPAYNPTRFLWIRQKIYYSNGSTNTTQETHDAQFDDVLQTASTNAENIDSMFTTINGIQVSIDGQSNTLGELDDRLTDAENLASYLTGNYEDLSSDFSSLKVIINGIEVSLDDYARRLKELHDANGQTSKELSEKSKELADIIDAFDNYTNDQRQYMRHGEQGLELGAEDSPFKTVIDNRRMAFVETVEEDGALHDVTTAYVSGKMFKMVNAQIVEGGSLTKGGYQEQVRADGSIIVVWVGVE